MYDGFDDLVAVGARNLLIDCAGCHPGQSLLIVHETDDVGYYDPDLGYAIKDVGDQCGLVTEMFGVPLNREVCDPSDALLAKMERADCTIFLARLGDQIRFRPKVTHGTQIICYALDREMLASAFGTIPYRAFEMLSRLINDAVAKASHIHVTCPAGTDFSGRPAMFSAGLTDTTRKRFPVPVCAPIPGDGFRGRIAQNGFLVGTGSHYYTPWSCELKETLLVNFEGTRITGFDGAPGDVAAAMAHYEFVGRTYGIDTYHLHSWHAGIHPGCSFKDPAHVNFERWGGSAFGNPRLLHLHSCGAYPPGEISLNLLDPTVRFDGVPVWEGGRLYPERLAGGQALLDSYPEMRDAFQHPATNVGQAANGQLSYV